MDNLLLLLPAPSPFLVFESVVDLIRVEPINCLSDRVAALELGRGGGAGEEVQVCGQGQGREGVVGEEVQVGTAVPSPRPTLSSPRPLRPAAASGRGRKGRVRRRRRRRRCLLRLRMLIHLHPSFSQSRPLRWQRFDFYAFSDPSRHTEPPKSQSCFSLMPGGSS